MSSPEIEATILPNDWSPETLAQVLPIYKQFRLFSLKTAPKAFAMTYNQEIEFPNERWIKRLSNQDAIHFIATYADKRPSSEAWKREPWLGSFVLVRVHDAQEENAFDGGAHVDKSEDSVSLTFHMNAMFIDPAVRGKGIGKKLLQAGFAFMREEAGRKGISKVRVTTLVDSWNNPAIGLYAGQGFKKIGTDSYTVDSEMREADEMEYELNVK